MLTYVARAYHVTSLLLLLKLLVHQACRRVGGVVVGVGPCSTPVSKQLCTIRINAAQQAGHCMLHGLTAHLLAQRLNVHRPWVGIDECLEAARGLQPTAQLADDFLHGAMEGALSLVHLSVSEQQHLHGMYNCHMCNYFLDCWCKFAFAQSCTAKLLSRNRLEP